MVIISKRWLSLIALFFLMQVSPLAGGARAFVSLEEALKLAFPGCETRKETAYLTLEQTTRASRLAGAAVDDSVVTRYVAQCGGEAGGFGYVDSHVIRTHRESLLILVSPQGTVRRVEMLSFFEPHEYIPKPRWYSQFEKHALDEELQLKRAISPVTGASLTARATTSAVRRVLALHQAMSSVTSSK